MCGVAGILSSEGAAHPEKRGELAAMLKAIEHRGPDGSGIWQDSRGYVALGHRRLSIVDLSPTGAQPMVTDGGRGALSLNGEIYNYVELRAELDSAGCRFHGHSDTEVLLNALRHWGVDKTLPRLVGMFAFAYWDDDAQSLHLVRDRIGKKPLYYFCNRRCFYFASEIKAIKQVRELNLSIDRAALYHYLSLGFVPGPLTIYQNLHEVEPGSHLVIDRQLKTSAGTYWELPTKADKPISLAEASAEAESQLAESIRLRLRADVPVGVFLSGGIDSGLITALAAQQSPRPIQTFTVGISESGFDEASMAREVAERYSTDHHEVRLNPDVGRLIELTARVYDEPFGDPSAIPTLMIASETSRHTKVVLNGEGSDELFGGYRRARAAKLVQQLAPLRATVPTGLLEMMRRLAPAPRSFRTGYSFSYRFMQGLHPDPFIRYLRWSSDGLRDDEKRVLLRDVKGAELSTGSYLAERFSRLETLGPLDHFMTLDLLLGMTDCLLVKLDMATMAYGLEARCPFLDHRLIEWAAGLRRLDLLKASTTKPVLRMLARRYLPDAIVNAPKRGFELPLFDWVGGALYNMVREVCLGSTGILLDICERKQLYALVERRIELDRERWAKVMWLLLMLAMWYQQARAR